MDPAPDQLETAADADLDLPTEVDRPAGSDGASEAPAAGPSVNSIIALLLAVVGLRIGLSPLHDNSFFTHLATGRLILDGGIPRVDPYSFTANGEPWTVQSWGASTIYAGLDQLVGLVGIRVLIAVCCVAITQLVWRLTSPAQTLIGRLAVTVPVIAVGTAYWVERPLIFSLVFVLAVMFALEDRLDPRWLVPVMWLWVNIHGSFPMAFAAAGVYLVGTLLDRQRPKVELRVLGWVSLGTLLGGLLSPLGWRLLVFPGQLLQRREAFENISEWQPPDFTSSGERMFALQLVLALGLVLLRERRWRRILPVLVFGALSLQASRNIVHASLIMIPAMVAGAHGLGTIDGSVPQRMLRPVRAALIALLVLVGAVGVFQQPDVDLQDYPVASLRWMREEGLLDRDDRVVTRDFVGNFLEVRYGPDEVQVFFDDRVDMYPDEVIAQYNQLVSPDGDMGGVLDEVEATAVLWDTDSDLGDWLEDPDNGWVIVHREPDWIVATPAEATG